MWQTAPWWQLSANLLGPLQQPYICDVEIRQISEQGPLGVAEAEGLHDAMVRQDLVLQAHHALRAQLVACWR